MYVPCAVDMTVIFTFSCSFVCTGQHAALCVSMSQAVGSLRTAPICGLHPTTSPMKALRSTSRCGDGCSPIRTSFGMDKVLVAQYNWDDYRLIIILQAFSYLRWIVALIALPRIESKCLNKVTLTSSEICNVPSICMMKQPSHTHTFRMLYCFVSISA